MASGSLCPSPYQVVLDTVGVSVSGAKITTTLAGTSTPVATFTDQALTTPNANPIIADSAGRYVAFLTPGVGYKFAIADAASVPIRTVDGILAAPATPFNVASGGTGATTFAAHGVLIGEGTSAVAATGAGTAGQVLTSNGASADPTFQAPPIDIGLNDFRVTLTSGNPVTTADVLAAVTLFCTPYKGNRIALYDNVGTPTIYTSAEFSIAVPAVANQMYDIFCFANAGVPTLELTSWTNDTTRATAIVLTTTGAYTKSGDLTRRYLGSFRTTAVAGQTEDAVTKRFVWNYHNRARRTFTKAEAAVSWNYSTNTIRALNNSTTNRVEAVVGVLDTGLVLNFAINVASDAAALGEARFGFGLDSTTAFAANQVGATVTVGGVANMQYVGMAIWNSAYPAVGYHFFQALEQANVAAATATWRASGTSPGLGVITGWIEG